MNYFQMARFFHSIKDSQYSTCSADFFVEIAACSTKVAAAFITEWKVPSKMTSAQGTFLPPCIF